MLLRVWGQIGSWNNSTDALAWRAAWLEEFTAELLAFPGRHDDQVDALTQGLFSRFVTGLY
jgi:phage terminase large subunit-like protein